MGVGSLPTSRKGGEKRGTPGTPQVPIRFNQTRFDKPQSSVHRQGCRGAHSLERRRDGCCADAFSSCQTASADPVIDRRNARGRRTPVRRLGQVLCASIRVMAGCDELLRLTNADRRIDRRDHNSDQRVLVHSNRS